MKKNVSGIFGLLVAVFVITAIADPQFSLRVQHAKHGEVVESVRCDEYRGRLCYHNGRNRFIHWLGGWAGCGGAFFFHENSGPRSDCGDWVNLAHVGFDWIDSRLANHQGEASTFRGDFVWTVDLSKLKPVVDR